MIKFPYTDFHEMNLDWILKTVKESDTMSSEAATTAQNAAAQAATAAQQAGSAVTTAAEALDLANEANDDAAETVTAVNRAFEELAFSHKFKMPQGNTAVDVEDPYYGFAVIIGDNDIVSSFWKIVYSDHVSSVQMIFPTSELPSGTVDVSAHGSQFWFSNALNSTVHALLFDIAGTASVGGQPPM